MTNEENNFIDSIVNNANKIKSKGWVLLTSISIIRNLFIALLFICIWNIIQPNSPTEQVVIGILAFIISTIAGGKFKKYKIEKKNFILSMEMRFPNTKLPITALNQESQQVSAEQEWKPLIENELKRIKVQDKRKIKNHLSSIAIPAIFSSLLLINFPLNLQEGFATVAGTMFNFNKSFQLKVVKGGSDDEKGKPYNLSPNKPVTLELSAKNNILLTIKDASLLAAPTIQLKHAKSENSMEEAGSLFQSFQLIPINENADKKATTYQLTFTASKNVDLFIPMLSPTKPVASFKIKILPIPRVKLTLDPVAIKQPWADEKPLGLRIIAKAKNPLRSISILIRTGKKESEERVFNIMTEDVFDVNKTHDLILEQYVESDLAQVELVAQVIDRSAPIPLVGYSEPITIQTASAYGRYRNTLTTLKEIKTIIDTNLSKQDATLSEDVVELGRKAYEQSKESPFFDGLDRVEITRFKNQIEKNFQLPKMNPLFILSKQLNEFLAEHETLDDRERDRDFFVATRAISRLLEKPKNKRPVKVTTVAQRLKTFLDDRYARWTLRVARIGEHTPESWEHIKNDKPFHKTMDDISKLDESTDPSASSQSIDLLSKTVTKYRDWINALEDAEDKAREQKEQERQQGLSNARNEIRELQKQQGHISTKLDKAATREKQNLEEQWSMVNMKQNNNIKHTKKLSDKMRSLSPEAGMRIDAALEAMESTKNAGGESNFVLAESSSDMAGRLLRQANSAAKKAQSKKQSRGRRKRVLGDKYYGKNVTGGDVEIKREYEVDRRYREDILDEVSTYQGDSQEDEAILNNYLREVVR